MAAIKPVVSSGSPLITPGWPMAQVPMANPHASVQLKEGTQSAPATSTATKAALVQSGHLSDGVDR